MNYDELVILSKTLLADEAIQLIPLLEDKLKAKESISQIIQRNKIKIKCPHCKGKAIKHGTKNNIQRYKCSKCNRTFSNTTNTITYKTHFSFNKWIKFVHCELLGLTIAQTAKEIDTVPGYSLVIFFIIDGLPAYGCHATAEIFFLTFLSARTSITLSHPP